MIKSNFPDDDEAQERAEADREGTGKDGRLEERSVRAGESSAKPEVRAQRPSITPQYLDYIPDPPPADAQQDASDTDDHQNDRPLPAREDIYAQDDKSHVLLEVLDWMKYIIIAVILGILTSQFVLQRSAVVGNSMTPTLLNAEQLMVEKVSVHFGVPDRGSIITIDSGKIDSTKIGETLVKRLIGRPGETIDFIDGVVYIDGQPLTESYLPEDTFTSAPLGWSGPQIVPEGHVFVMGDNRAFSADSRVFGYVPLRAVEGQVLVRIFPFSRFGTP